EQRPEPINPPPPPPQQAGQPPMPPQPGYPPQQQPRGPVTRRMPPPPPQGPGPRGGQQPQSGYGTLSVRVQPIDAEISIDGEPWRAPAGQARVGGGVTEGPRTLEVKATLFDKKVQGMVGGSAGWVFDETLFVGGGGYWMAQRRGSDHQLAYGGAVVQWFAHNGSTFGWSAKALLGGGRATLPETVTQVILPPLPDPRA